MRNLEITEADSYPLDVGGRKPYVHPVTGENLPEQGKPTRIWGLQRAYLRHVIEALPQALRSGGEDAAVRHLIDVAMRREFGEDYAARCHELAAQENSRLAAESVRRSAKKAKRSKKK